MAKLIAGVNDLATVNPELAAEWHPTKNGDLKPEDISFGSAKPVWWLCPDCGHEWEVSPNSRMHSAHGKVSLRGCPDCGRKHALVTRNNTRIKQFGSLQEILPELAAEWHPTKNGDLSPSNVTPYSNIKVWWQCSFCGYEWRAQIRSRSIKVKGSCKSCGARFRFSSNEKALYYFVLTMFPDALCNVSETTLPFLEKKELDIYIPEFNIGVEYDGCFWHKNTNDTDCLKTLLCQKHGITLFRLREHGLEKLSNNDTVVGGKTRRDLLAAIKELLNTLSQASDGRTPPSVEETHTTSQMAAFIHAFKLQHSLALLHPELLKDWDYSKNGALKPENLPVFSNEPVHWRCSVCDYEWVATPGTRAKGHGCAVCGRKKAAQAKSRNSAIGGNSIADKNPLLAQEWDYAQNPPDRNPQNVSPWSDTLYYWICPVCHTSYLSSVTNRTSGQGCPACAEQNRRITRRKTEVGLKGSLSEMMPELASEWNYEKNAQEHLLHPTHPSTPQEVTPGSGAKVWWLCEQGHEWKAVVYSRKAGNGCPICTGRKTKEYNK